MKEREWFFSAFSSHLLLSSSFFFGGVSFSPCVLLPSVIDLISDSFISSLSSCSLNLQEDVLEIKLFDIELTTRGNKKMFRIGKKHTRKKQELSSE